MTHDHAFVILGSPHSHDEGAEQVVLECLQVATRSGPTGNDQRGQSERRRIAALTVSNDWLQASLAPRTPHVSCAARGGSPVLGARDRARLPELTPLSATRPGIPSAAPITGKPHRGSAQG